MDNRVAVLMTTFNRREMTIASIKSIADNNQLLQFDFIVFIDGSSDGTEENLGKLPYSIITLHGDGNFFWNRGMYYCMKYVLNNKKKYDCILWINDDVHFFAHTIEKMYLQLIEKHENVIVGSTCSENGNVTYGAIKYLSKKKLKYRMLMPQEQNVEIDTFNGNCVLFKIDCVISTGNLDKKYLHGMGDFDYGFMLTRKGFHITLFEDFVGICNRNLKVSTWLDTSLTRKERIQLKESPKGLPFKDWFHFLNKNFGLAVAIHRSVTPYIKIIIRK